MAQIPAYRMVYSDIKQSIKNGTYPPGVFLPTETELGTQFDTSRTTIRKAISLLVTEGYLSVKQGRGTQVLDNTATQKLNSVSSFTETLVQKGYVVSTKGVFVELIKAGTFIAQKLNIKEEDSVYHIQRVQFADNSPIAIMENYLVSRLFPNFRCGYVDFISLYTLLEKDYGLIIKEAYQTISAEKASFSDAQILNISVGNPLLVSSRVTYSADKVAFEYSLSKIIAEKYNYSIYLSGR